MVGGFQGGHRKAYFTIGRCARAVQKRPLTCFFGSSSGHCQTAGCGTPPVLACTTPDSEVCLQDDLRIHLGGAEVDRVGWITATFSAPKTSIVEPKSLKNVSYFWLVPSIGPRPVDCSCNHRGLEYVLRPWGGVCPARVWCATFALPIPIYQQQQLCCKHATHT